MNAETAELLASFLMPVVYPGGNAGRPFDDPRSRPMALVIGTLANHGSKDPWIVPCALQERLGLDALLPASLRAAGKKSIEIALQSLHRSPRELARWIHSAAVLGHAQYGGDVSWAWNSGRGIEAPRLFSRLMDFPGIGPAKAMMLMHLLEHDWNVPITAWESLEAGMTDAMKRMAARIGWCEDDPPDPRRMPAMYEGLRSLANEFCLERPACGMCPLDLVCPKNGVD